MNRSIIDEDDEFEVLGVIQLIDETPWTQYGHTFGYDMIGYLKMKMVNHSVIASEVMKRSFRAKNLDTHLIVGLPIPHILDGFLW